MLTKLITKLKNKGIGARPFFWPMNKQQILKDYKFKKGNFKNSEYISKYGFYLPTSLSIKNYQIDYICKQVNEIIN